MNKVILSGNLGRDPEVRMAGETKVATFSIAVKEKRKGEEYTEWVNIQYWGKIADVCEKYLKKGSKILCEGKLKTESWSDKTTGEKKYKTIVVGQTMEMLGGRSEQTDSNFANAPTADFTAPPPPEDGLPF